MIFNYDMLLTSPIGSIHGDIVQYPIYPREKIKIGDFITICIYMDSKGIEHECVRPVVASNFDGVARTSAIASREYDSNNIVTIYTKKKRGSI